MTRTIKPIGPVSDKLASAGYRQYAVILVDGVQVERTAVLSIQVADKIKYVGYHIDANGEIHHTAKLPDMKKAAARILHIIGATPMAAPATKPAAMAPNTKPRARKKPAAKPAAQSDATAVRRARRAAKRQPGGDRIAGTDALIDCPGCGCLHRDDQMCL